MEEVLSSALRQVVDKISIDDSCSTQGLKSEKSSTAPILRRSQGGDLRSASTVRPPFVQQAQQRGLRLTLRMRLTCTLIPCPETRPLESTRSALESDQGWESAYTVDAEGDSVTKEWTVLNEVSFFFFSQHKFVFLKRNHIFIFFLTSNVHPTSMSTAQVVVERGPSPYLAALEVIANGVFLTTMQVPSFGLN